MINIIAKYLVFLIFKLKDIFLIKSEVMLMSSSQVELKFILQNTDKDNNMLNNV